MPDKTTPQTEKAIAAAGEFIYQGPGPQPMELRLRARDCARAVLSTTLEPSELELSEAEAAFVESQKVNASAGLHGVYRKDIRAALIAAAQVRVRRMKIAKPKRGDG